jgi:Ni/Fe-hydrogenase subunit HybB-like protein
VSVPGTTTPPRGGQAHEPAWSAAAERIGAIVLERRFRWPWWTAACLALALTLAFGVATGVLFEVGVGIWGLNIPVAWGYALTNYVWWIGIGMAGTFISAALLVLRQNWRTAINRFAETMTVFAVAIAGLFPIMHLGRPWFVYWLFPYPNAMNLAPQWRSSLVWDLYAILAYLIVSILFWYVGLLPDFAALRDRARGRGRQIFYGLLALGWRGEARHWARHEALSLLLSGLAVPLVFSVHSMVALDFSEGNTPGWHSTIFPPFFVAGALYSGFALVLCLGVPLRAIFGLEHLWTQRHLDLLAKIVLAAGLFVAYSYAAEIFTAYYSGDPFEIAHVEALFGGLYAPLYWSTIVCNVLIPQALWLPAVRARPLALVLIGAAIVLGMWLERFTIVIASLYRDFMPSAWGRFVPTVWDWTHLIGSIGVFALLMLLALRLLPAVSMFEVRKSLHDTPPEMEQDAR